jgi:hypothetical protein
MFGGIFRIFRSALKCLFILRLLGEHAGTLGGELCSSDSDFVCNGNLYCLHILARFWMTIVNSTVNIVHFAHGLVIVYECEYIEDWGVLAFFLTSVDSVSV